MIAVACMTLGGYLFVFRRALARFAARRRNPWLGPALFAGGAAAALLIAAAR